MDATPQPAEPKKTPLTGLTRLAWKIFRCVLVAYLLVLLMMLFLENRLIFIPSKYPAGEWQPPGSSRRRESTA